MISKVYLSVLTSFKMHKTEQSLVKKQIITQHKSSSASTRTTFSAKFVLDTKTQHSAS